MEYKIEDLFTKRVGSFKFIAKKERTIEPDDTTSYYITIVCPDGTEFEDNVAYYNDTDYQKGKYKKYNNVILDFRCLLEEGITEVPEFKFYGTIFGVDDEIDNIIQDLEVIVLEMNLLITLFITIIKITKDN